MNKQYITCDTTFKKERGQAYQILARQSGSVKMKWKRNMYFSLSMFF